MRLSIVVPVLNEAHLVEAFLLHVRDTAAGAEIIVVDGGSQDETAQTARGVADQVITSESGRGRQMNIGATAASGDVFWFLHVDSTISRNVVAALSEFMLDDANVGGCFSLKIVPSRWVYRLRDTIGDWCVDHSGIALGDRGLFCRRDAFLTAGGYPVEALFEDADFYRSLARVGHVRRLNATIETSSRRYEDEGPLRTCAFYGLVMLLYSIGVRRSTLENLVRRFSGRCRTVHIASIPQPQ